jgi:hypothetical protein
MVSWSCYIVIRLYRVFLKVVQTFQPRATGSMQNSEKILKKFYFFNFLSYNFFKLPLVFYAVLKARR